jgi:hypothetical protein
VLLLFLPHTHSPRNNNPTTPQTTTIKNNHQNKTKDASNRKIVGARDELRGQRGVLKQSHGLLGALKSQAFVDW